MKTQTFRRLLLGFIVATLPMASGTGQQSDASVPAHIPGTNLAVDLGLGTPTNVLAAEAVEEDLGNAEVQVVSTPASPPADADVSAAAQDLVKLAQAGVEEGVLLTFVANSPRMFNLSSEAIIYLNDVGVPGTVVTAMIQRDQELKEASAAAVTAATAAPPAPYYPEPEPATVVEEPAAAESYVAAESVPEAQVVVTPTYFYNSLAPYGSWIYVSGYGMCWQPSIVIINRSWRPYSDGGHWAYTDLGWYWVSNYSWGWAPFHYGRWFQHHRRGWCWAPGTTWGPAWVSWRYGGSHCGWAPLPPAAHYRPGIGFTHHGRHVSSTFSFGLAANAFTFVHLRHLTDRHWHHHRLSGHEVQSRFHDSRVSNRIHDHRGTRVHEGVPVNHVAAVTHRPVDRIALRDAPSAARARAWRAHDGGRTLSVFRPGERPGLMRAASGPERHRGAAAQPGANLRARGLNLSRNGSAAVQPNSSRQRPGAALNAPDRPTTAPLKPATRQQNLRGAAPLVQRTRNNAAANRAGRQPLAQAPRPSATVQSQAQRATLPPNAIPPAAPRQNPARVLSGNNTQNAVRPQPTTQPQDGLRAQRAGQLRQQNQALFLQQQRQMIRQSAPAQPRAPIQTRPAPAPQRMQQFRPATPAPQMRQQPQAHGFRPAPQAAASTRAMSAPAVGRNVGSAPGVGGAANRFRQGR